jgi:serine/threonine protein kinase
MERVLDDTYRLLEEIGKGGFGAVYKGVRKGFEGMGPVAIKVLNRSHSMKPKDYARFQREASLMSQLAHPGIVSVYELVQTDACYYIVMELVTGMNLREFVTDRGGSLGLPDVLEVLIQAADALEYVHGHQIQHRDIKPQNILICDRGHLGDARFQVKLVDFGVARLAPQALGGETLAQQEIVGTFAYMPPESTGLVSYPVDHRCDIYSLGIVAFELLAGRVPFLRSAATDVARAHAFEKAPTISEVLGRDLAPVIEGLVAKCIAKNPADRYQSVFGLSCDLKRIRDELKQSGRISFFEISQKDLDVHGRFASAYLGHGAVVQDVLKILSAEKSRSRLNWVLIKAGAGCGKSRFLHELRTRLEHEDSRYLYLKFSESERRLPYQALAMAVNDYLTSFERSRLSELKYLFDDLVKRSGSEGAHHLAALIPALRDHLDDFETEPQQNQVSYASTASTVLNQAFKELFDSMVGKSKRLVFLLDDLHLGDASTLALLMYLLEGMNTSVNFSFVITIRDGLAQLPIMVDALLNRASGLRRRFHEISLPPFDENTVATYLGAIGVENLNFDFVHYVIRRTDSSPHQIQLLVKKLLEKSALVLHRHQGGEVMLAVDWPVLRSVKIELLSVDALISSLDRLESRDREILVTSAICQDPTPFELYRLDSEFSIEELETRLTSLVHRGLLGESGDDVLPLTRRRFALTHERLRSALLADIKISRVKEIHLLVATRIKQLYRNPGRAEVLLHAKHVDGAAELHEAKGAAISFIKAARVCIAEGEHNLGRYYLEKAQMRQQLMDSGPVASQLAKEIHEARYMIFAAQGNLVAASEACRSLIELTNEPDKKEKLEIYWAQLQLSLGRHSVTYHKSKAILETQLSIFSVLGLGKDSWLGRCMSRLEEGFGELLMRAIGTRWFALVCWILALPYQHQVRRMARPEAALQCLALMMLAQLHGHESGLPRSLVLWARLGALRQKPERWGALMQLLLAALQIRKGHTRDAYRIAENVEAFFSKKGNIEALRWLQSLRAIWFDYPSGRIDRLLQLFGSPRAGGYPTSGILHFETYGLRAWLRLIAPSSFPSVDLDRRRDRRRDSRGREMSTATKGKAALAGPGVAAAPADSLLESNNARRVLDSGENGQFTALALFSDAFRFALSDRVESLKRAAEQMRRQKCYSVLGDAFQMFGTALLSHVSGRHTEALRYYKKACRRILYSEAHVIALPVSDALRFAVLFFPLVANASGRQKWLWGPSLVPWLQHVDAKLRRMEGHAAQRKSSMSMLFAAMTHYARGETRSALTELDGALRESRVQKMALLECLSLGMMGMISAERKIARAQEHVSSFYATAGQFRWKLFERFALALARKHKLDWPEQQRQQPDPLTMTARGRSTQGGLKDLVRHLPELLECPDANKLASEASRVAARALGLPTAMVFLRQSGSSLFEHEITLGADHPLIQESGLTQDEIRKWLPTHLDEHVKLVSLDSRDADPGTAMQGHPSIPEYTTQEMTQNATLRLPAEAMVDPDKTVAGVFEQSAPNGPSQWSPSGTATATNTLGGQVRLLILIALTNQGELLGWVVLPDSGGRAALAAELDQELMILGMHVGHLLARLAARSGPRSENSLAAPDRSMSQRNEHLEDWPDYMRIEDYNSGAHWPHAGWRVYGVQGHLLLACVWRLEGARERDSRRLGDLIARHLQLFVHSLRLQPEKPRMVPVSERLISDFMAIFGSMPNRQRGFDTIDLNFLVFDYESRQSFEGVFGTDLFSFAGESRVERESLHEILGVMGNDQALVFRERQRAVKGHGGWAFGIDSQSRVALHRFADVDFLERYLPHVLSGQFLLPETLGVQSRGSQTQMLAVFALDPDALSLQQSGSGLRTRARGSLARQRRYFARN